MNRVSTAKICIAASAFSFATQAHAGEAAKEIVELFGIDTHTATRKDDNFYEIAEGFFVRTKYCYVYAYSEDVVLTKTKIIFIDDDDVCDVEGIYRK